jgi:hypothetical protein
VKASHGNLTDDTVARKSQAFQLTKDMRRDYENILRGFEGNESMDTTSHNTRREKWKDDLLPAVQVLLKEKLFMNKGARSHPGFQNFKYDMLFVKNSYDFKMKIQKFLTSADNFEECRNRNKE